MICFIDNKPILLIGRHQLVGYDTEWLRHALEKAAHKADFPEFPMLEYVLEAIEMYLETDCPLGSLSIESLYEKIRTMLNKAGCPSIANHLSLESPLLKISLKEIASEVGETYELGFFEALVQELKDFERLGVSNISFIHSREAVQLLTASKRWNKRCRSLFSELENYLDPYQLAS